MGKVIVTGANGLIGSYLVNYLASQKKQIYAIVRNPKSNLRGIDNNPFVKIIYCDLLNIGQLPDLIKDEKFEVFYHLAWEGSSGEPRKNYSLQLMNAEKVVEAINVAAKLQCRKFVCSGSVTELMCANYLPLDESQPEEVMAYPIAKTAAHYMGKSRCRALNMEFCWTYIANLFGVGDDTQNIVNMVVKSYLAGQVPELTKGEQLADFIYVSDVAGALAAVGEKGRDGASYYIGGRNVRPLREFIIDINSIVAPEVDSGLGRKPFFGRSLDFGKIETTKLEKDTGFVPQVAFRVGIEMLLKWLKEEKR